MNQERKIAQNTQLEEEDVKQFILLSSHILVFTQPHNNTAAGATTSMFHNQRGDTVGREMPRFFPTNLNGLPSIPPHVLT